MVRSIGVLFHNTKEENALKAKLRRLCAPNEKGVLKVSQWLHDQWKNGDHTAMAKQYAACGFDKDLVFLWKSF